MTRRRLALAAGLVVLALGGRAWGFAFLSPQVTWPVGFIVMHLQLGSSSGSFLDGSTSWNAVFEGALTTWNTYVTPVQFGVVRDSTAAIADGNNINNVFWSDTIYGKAFGEALAVATGWSRGSTRTEGDVIFNTSYKWNSYRGSIKQASGGGNLYDMRRVALHESGHVLGLDHPDDHGQSVSAVMNSRTSDLDSLTSDDTEGARTLYPLSLLPPGPPSGLTVSSSGSSVTLTWRAPTTGGAPLAYVLDVGSASGLSNLGTYATGSTATQFSAAGIASGAYYVRVRATNSAGSSPSSNEALISISGCAPAVPSGFRIVSNAGGTVVLAWNAVTGAASYVIEAGSASGLSNLVNANLGAVSSLTAINVGRGTYYARVRAVGACGQAGAASSEIVLVVS